MMQPQNRGVDDGGVTVDAVIEMFRAVTHLLSPTQRVTFLRILQDGMKMVPPDSDPHLRARINVAKAVPPKVIDSMATALESFVVWQQSADTNPEELRGYTSFEEHRPLFEALVAFVKILGFNLSLNHFHAVTKARAAVRAGRNLSGPEGLTVQAHLDTVVAFLGRGGRKRRKPEPAGVK